ncbi:MAG: chemotaxis protein CheD [Clostridiaceae bacterium]|nr:chemotaxis protein CheD [Clostridiaceae bacterium]
MAELIKVGMADLKVARHPSVLTTLGLGSCVGIALYENKIRVIGLAHIMLPSSTISLNVVNRAKFADTAIVDLIDKMIDLGADKNNIVAKLAGGAQMFSFSSGHEIMRIGQRNIEAARSILKELQIPIISEDVGGNYGRTIELSSKDGMLKVKSIGAGIKFI